MANNQLWQTKLHARLHDPIEKALVLLRDPAGHEGGNSQVLWRLAGYDELSKENLDNDNADVIHAVAFTKGIKRDTYRLVQRADWWAAAADRPQLPLDEVPATSKAGEIKTLAVQSWAQVRWTKSKDGTNNTVLVHPLTGEKLELSGGLSETDISDIKQRAFDHLSQLLIRQDGTTDYKKTTLAMWRFGSDVNEDSDNGKLGELWNLLPADTRIPDHSIWDHLDLTSAFAGAFADDPEGDAALLSLSIGPVQPFIAAARTTSDLWAGSHLLSRLSWEAMRTVCEQLGPDAILFPRLRGIPQVDLWLRDEMGLPEELFTKCEWQRGSTDSNPLFSAALPNRFVALVPASKARAIAEQAEKNVRKWLQTLGDDVITLLLTTAGYSGEQENITTPRMQMKEQLQGFPEVHWAAVPFSLIRRGDGKNQRDLDTSQLSTAMRPFFSGQGEPGFLSSSAWTILQKELALTDTHGKKTTFFTPNPGVLYPAVFDLAERVMAAAKTSRTFAQTKQEGWRCSLTGEHEWLTTDPAQLHWNQNYRQQQGTLWTMIAREKPSWAKKGEHLSALPAIKRVWPTLFKEEAGRALSGKEPGETKHMDRFVVSTHTMALAHQMDQWLERGGLTADGFAERADEPDVIRVALPRRLMRQHKANQQALRDASLLPSLLDKAAQEEVEEQEAKRLLDAVRRTLCQGATETAKDIKLETYYSLIMMDGDHMGAILSGDPNTDTTITYEQSFHPKVQTGFSERVANQPELAAYGSQNRAITPNRHLAISGALNDFSQTVVRHVVEEEHLGRVIYSGGDDVLAMLPIADVLSTMQRLRHAYSGAAPQDEPVDWGQVRSKDQLVCKSGYAWLNGRLMRMMGKHASASCGAVIAHHQAPLSAVMHELRAAENRAKNEGDRDAFSITLVKRSGGALYLTENWGEPIRLLQDLRDFLASDGVSRRAVYHTLAWLNEHELPADAFETDMAHRLLEYQLTRQSSGDTNRQAPGLARRLIEHINTGSADEGLLTLEELTQKRVNKLRNFLSVAEFLARETRTGGNQQ